MANITKTIGEQELPARFEVCPRCHGKGTHDHPAFANGITSDDWSGPDWDDDSREGYLTGRYDVPCTECAGQRVVAVVDVSRCTFSEKRELVEHRRAMAELRRDERSERFMFGDA